MRMGSGWGGSYLVQLVMQLGQGGADELLPKRRRGLPVEVNVGNGVDGVVSEGAQVVGVGVGVVMVVVLPSRG